MPATTFHSAGKLLRKCERVPTMHSLPAPVIRRLERLTNRARFGGRRASDADIVSILVLFCAPESASDIAALLRRPAPRDVRASGPEPLAFLPAQRRTLW